MMLMLDDDDDVDDDDDDATEARQPAQPRSRVVEEVTRHWNIGGHWDVGDDDDDDDGSLPSHVPGIVRRLQGAGTWPG